MDKFHSREELFVLSKADNDDQVTHDFVHITQYIFLKIINHSIIPSASVACHSEPRDVQTACDVLCPCPEADDNEWDLSGLTK